MNTLFDLNEIPEKLPNSAAVYEYVITYTDDEGIQWFYHSGVSGESPLTWTRQGDRKLPKRYTTLTGANAQCRALNKLRNKAAIEANIACRVIVYREKP